MQIRGSFSKRRVTELLDALDDADDLNFTNETKQFLHLLRKGFDKKGIPGEVQRILSSQGQRMLKDGKPLNEADGVKNLQERFAQFESETLPLLQVLCIE